VATTTAGSKRIKAGRHSSPKSEVSEIASKNAENCRCRQPQCCLMPSPGNNCKYPQTLHRQKVESLAYIFAVDSMGLSSFKFFWWASKDASFLQQSAYQPFKMIQGG